MPYRTYNLILLYNKGALDVRDFETIAEHVRRSAPDIEVFIAKNAVAMTVDQSLPADIRRSMDRLIGTSREVAKSAAGRPTLVFSPQPLRGFRPMRGKVYCGRTMTKLDQMKRLKEAGLPVPPWKVIEPGIRLRPQRWGPVVIVKPNAWAQATGGKGVQMMRAEDVRYKAPEEYPLGHPGRKGPMLAQKFVDTGEYPEEFRVLTLFGEPLYAIKRKTGSPRPPLDAPAEVLEAAPVPITAGGRGGFATFCFDKEVLALARRVHEEGFPEVPLQACDIMRDVKDSRHYVLEINPGGNTWHFSSGGVASPFVEGKRREEQFRAFERAAEVLVARTRAEAV